MTTKKVESVIAPKPAHFVGDGFRVHNFIPGDLRFGMKRMDPFIMLDYNAKHYFEPSESPKGVGAHPHRGFETVTIAYHGKVQHHDSAGGGGIIREGDVQWMTAAKGVLHKEYHEKEWSKQGGWFQMVQIWVNLPSVYKMSCPKYQSIKNSEIKKIDLGENGFLELIAGNYHGKKGSAKTFTPLHMINAKLNKGGKAEFSFPEHYNTAVLVVEGNITINNTEKAAQDHFILFENSGENFTIEADENAIVLILSGEPLNENIVAHGPFVMNSKKEIMQAFEDFNLGRFGYLED